VIIVGAIGLVISLFWMGIWADNRRRSTTTTNYPPDERYSSGPGA
jgi:hypothetical protein